MKMTKILLCAVVVGAMAFTAKQASAFPLALKTESGTMNLTGTYGPLGDPSLTSNKIAKVSYNLKKVLACITNELQLRGTNSTTPLNYTFMYDPYTQICFLTNADGYFVNLTSSNIATVFLDDVVTSFKGSGNGGSEKDLINVELWIHNVRPPQSEISVQFDAFGPGTISASENGNTGIAKMTITEKGIGFTDFNNSDEGIITGSTFTFTGTGTPGENQLPFSIYWWNVLD